MLIAMLVWALPGLADTATVVNGARVNLRSGKTDTYRVIKALAPGTVVEVLRLERTYVQVKTTEGDVGWLPLRLVKIAVAPPAKQAEPEPNFNLQTLQAQLAQTQAELEHSRGQQTGLPLWLVVSAGGGGLVLGILLGIGGLQAYYRKRLKGLRI